MARTDTGSLLVAGERGSDLRIGRYAADGTPEWSKDVHVTDATVADWSAITPTADGAIIAGKVRRGTTAVERPTLVALDDAGDLQWATEIDPGPGSGDATIVEVVETPSGELLAVGDVAYELPDRSIDQWNVLIMRLDPNNGTPLASYVLGGPYSDRATGVAVQPDGSYAISGQSTVTPGTNDSWVASFDADDNLRWSSTYADRLDAGYDTATGIATVAGGDYVVSGTNGSVAKDGWMIRIDGSGMPMWSKSYVGADEDELVGVVAMPVGVAAFGLTNTTNPLSNSLRRPLDRPYERRRDGPLRRRQRLRHRQRCRPVEPHLDPRAAPAGPGDRADERDRDGCTDRRDRRQRHELVAHRLSARSPAMPPPGSLGHRGVHGCRLTSRERPDPAPPSRSAGFGDGRTAPE